MSASKNLTLEALGIPKNSEWGPVLWEILHGLVERIGKTTNPQILMDQRRELILVLRFTENIMPCALCRKHFHTWRTTHALEKLPLGSKEFVESVRQWLFNLHNEVNLTRNISSAITLEQLPERYGAVELKVKFEELSSYLNRALLFKQIEPEAVKKFRTHLNLLFALIR